MSANHPFCVTHAMAIGVSPGKRAGMLHRDSYATLDEAKERAMHLPPGHHLLLIAEGEGVSEIVHYPCFSS